MRLARVFLPFGSLVIACATADRPAAAQCQTASPSHQVKSKSAPQAPNFQSFKSGVQPIFLKERPGHARCYGCHSAANRAFHLATLSPGLSDWTEGQSRQNF